ncbi:oxidoreductase [Actinomadura sp. 7K507]|uniref:oxidoreductase n=1 Tax=Actinomadura sp. 7K507 TaxID=2530365 RepID=UPI00104E0CC4|nr:oxidoreductase [Actinomadura sp. 7K507]TDC82251.1 oxidoreductase [Actinomadura sp. 7K507]
MTPPVDPQPGEHEPDLLRGAIAGTLIDLRTGDAERDDPAGAAEWGPERTVRAGTLADLLTRRPPDDPPLRAVKLRGATIGGTLTMTRAHLDAPGADALAAARLTVGDDMFCGDLTADGEMRLPGARIGGRLDLSRARLTNPGATALTADRLTVEDGVLAEGFTAEGEVRLPGAQINAPLILAGARLTDPGGQALNLEGATATALILLPGHRPEGDVNLTGARVGTFDDDPATWPATIRLRGFTYDALGDHGDTADARTRIAWLTRDPGGYVPQLYDQLTAVYRRAGDEQAAHKVAVAKQWRRRAELNPAGKLTNWLLYLTVGYGYRTWQAAVWLAVLLALGTWIFTEAHPHDLTRADRNAPAFNPFGYTLDVLLPIVDLGQQKAWRAQDAAMYWTWTFIASGWILTTAVVAGLTGILKRT